MPTWLATNAYLMVDSNDSTVFVNDFQRQQQSQLIGRQRQDDKVNYTRSTYRMNVTRRRPRVTPHTYIHLALLEPSLARYRLLLMKVIHEKKL